MGSPSTSENPMLDAKQEGSGLKPYNAYTLFIDGIPADNPIVEAKQEGPGLKPYNSRFLFTYGVLTDNPMIEATQGGAGVKPLISVLRPNEPRSIFSDYIYTINPLIIIYNLISSITVSNDFRNLDRK